MKITKKMRKKAKGMNAVTKRNFEDGHCVPEFRNISPVGQVANFIKTKKGVPYVNPNNFA